MLVVNGFASHLLAHQPLAAENLVQLQVLAVHHATRVIGHVDSLLWIVRSERRQNQKLAIAGLTFTHCWIESPESILHRTTTTAHFLNIKS